MNMMNHRFESVDQTTFRNGMSRLGSAVNVVTTIHEGRRYAFSCLQCQRYARNAPRLHQSREFVLSCLREHAPLLRQYADARAGGYIRRLRRKDAIAG